VGRKEAGRMTARKIHYHAHAGTPPRCAHRTAALRATTHRRAPQQLNYRQRLWRCTYLFFSGSCRAALRGMLRILWLPRLWPQPPHLTLRHAWHCLAGGHLIIMSAPGQARCCRLLPRLSPRRRAAAISNLLRSMGGRTATCVAALLCLSCWHELPRRVAASALASLRVAGMTKVAQNRHVGSKYDIPLRGRTYRGILPPAHLAGARAATRARGGHDEQAGKTRRAWLVAVRARGII